jgi:alpha-tubulin suppressor-like RCC1 family protein
VRSFAAVVVTVAVVPLLFAGGAMPRTLGTSAGAASTPVAISAGDERACALFSGGTIKCWGDNRAGELGNGTTTACSAGSTCFSSTPVSVKGISTAKAISAGGDAGTFSVGAGGACALLSGGTIKCWGDNRYGELGNGKAGSYLYPDSFTPVAVKGL